MSYCVNCGVELDPSLDFCPLCGTEVINPAAPAPHKREYPYPSRVETIAQHIDRKFLVSIAGTILLIPALITLFCDLIAGGGLNWSLYVVGALAMIFVAVFVPMLFRKPTVWLCMLFDIAVVAVYVLTIDLLTGGSWYLPLGLPIVLTFGLLMVLTAVLFSRPKVRGVLVRVAVILIDIGLLSLAIDFLVCGYLGRPLVPSWSVYVLVPCLLLAVCAMLLRLKKNFKEEIRRRFFI